MKAKPSVHALMLRRRLRLWMMIVALGAVFGPMINYLALNQQPGSLYRGFIDGIVIAGLVGGYAQFGRELLLQKIFRQMNFSFNVLANAFVYLILFQVGRLAASLIHSADQIGHLPDYFLARHMIVALPLFYFGAVMLEFVLQMNLLVGRNVMRYFLMGTYHKPREEERIFMFLDLQGSTTLAEQMGGSAYYALLEEFINALTGPVLETEGEIFGYIGDEVVITWRRDVGLKNGNCIQCFFRIDDVLTEMRDDFLDRFGKEPKYRAGMHGGRVTTGELGDIKREIVFVGDVVNTAARLEEYAKTNDKRFVVSDAIVDEVEMPPHVEASFIGDHQPRGKEQTIRLYEVLRAT